MELIRLLDELEDTRLRTQDSELMELQETIEPSGWLIHLRIQEGVEIEITHKHKCFPTAAFTH